MSRPLSITASLCVALAALAFDAAPASAFDHAAFDKILKGYVRSGRVDYAGIKRKAKADLDRYVAAIGKAKPSGSKNARLAFYLNAYNALVIKAVVERYPGIKSVLKVPGFFNKLRHKVAGRSVTLDQLEKKIILPNFKDVRVHFALVCAARSCPPLRAAAFRGAGLDKVLDRLAKNFINSRSGVQVSGSTVKISKIFKWYAKDFTRAAGSVGKFLAKYHKTRAALLAKTKSFSYLHYDWALNDK